MLTLTDPRGSDRSTLRLFPSSDSAILSPDGHYRYTLTRSWSLDLPEIAWVCLNPSTADATEDDATIRVIRGFSKRWDFGRLGVVNLFALRSTDPDALLDAADPIGPENDAHIEAVLARVARVVCAWGMHPASSAVRLDSTPLVTRESQVRAIISRSGKPCGVLSLTKSGSPRHPLRIPAATPWSVWQP